MARTYNTINDNLRSFIEAQHLFFVASAPLAADGHVNVSPKGQDCLRVLGPLQVAYLDLSMYPTAALQNAGADSCVAGQLKLMPGMLGTPSQVLAIAFLIHYNLSQHGHFVWQFRIHYQHLAKMSVMLVPHTKCLICSGDIHGSGSSSSSTVSV